MNCVKNKKKLYTLKNLSNLLQTLYANKEVNQLQINKMTKIEIEIYRTILIRKGIHVGQENDFKFNKKWVNSYYNLGTCLLYTSPSPRD